MSSADAFACIEEICQEVMPSRNVALFVHGCFWHRHENCKMASMPKTRQDFWREKFDANMARDQPNMTDLERLGWRVEVIWECETRKREALSGRLKHLLTNSSKS